MLHFIFKASDFLSNFSLILRILGSLISIFVMQVFSYTQACEGLNVSKLLKSGNHALSRGIKVRNIPI